MPTTSVHLVRAVFGLFAVLFLLSGAVYAQPDCTLAPYNVPAGKPTSTTTAAQDQAHLMCLQGLKFPTVASNPPLSSSRLTDPYKPTNAFPGTPATPETNWTDQLNHVVVRWGWGLWTTYDDAMGGGTPDILCAKSGITPCTKAAELGTATGGAMSGFGDYGPAGGRPYPTGNAPFGRDGTVCTSPGCLAAGIYPAIDLMTMKNPAYPSGTPVQSQVLTPEDWWIKRRPELFDLVQKELYGYNFDPSVNSIITGWVIGAVTTGTQVGGTVSCVLGTTGCNTNGGISDGISYPWRQKTYTATISTGGYPTVRNAPTLAMTCRFPANATGKVPVFIGIGGSATTLFAYTAPYGLGACGYTQTAVQADGGGAATSDRLSGLVNQGDWRKPTDPGTLVAWAWGISRMIDEFANDSDALGPDPDKVAVEGHSRNGKATLVTAAYDDRVVAALPSCGGAGGTSWLRRHYGESIESVVGSGEYYWMDGYLMNYAGPACSTNPNVGPVGCTPAYFPRKVTDLDVDAHAVMALIAPRAVMTNGGTDGMNGSQDAWQDPRGMYLAGTMSSPAWTMLGWPGQIIPQGTVFTTDMTPVPSYNNGESIGGTPPFNTAFTDGTVAWRRHTQGHTDAPEWPVFAKFASKYLNDVRPVVTAGQSLNFPIGSSSSVGPLTGTAGGAGSLQNWQIKGGNAAYVFALDRNTGYVTVPDRTQLNGNIASYNLTVMASDSVLPSHDTLVSIVMPADITASGIVTVTRGAMIYNFTTGRFTQSVVVKNNTVNTISGPISLVVDGLSSNASLFGATGVTATAAPLGSPYVNSASSIAAGKSVSILLQFTDPSRTPVTFTPRVLAGSTAR